MPRESDCHGHVPAEKAHLFECYNGGATEVEYLELLYAFVRATKPDRVLETGCFDGRGTLWLAHALACNGFGMLHSIDLDDRMLDVTARRIDEAGYAQHVTLHKGDTREVLKTMAADESFGHFGVAFFDSSLSIRADEAEICLDRYLVLPGSTLAFHDSSRLRGCAESPVFWKGFEERVRPRVSAVMELPLSRGMVIARV